MKKTNLMQALAQCIEACGTCASSCLNEADVKKMKACIATDLDCADICSAALQILSRDSAHSDAVIKACKTICESCEKTCQSHDMEHCQKCAKACKACAEACDAYLSVNA